MVSSHVADALCEAAMLGAVCPSLIRQYVEYAIDADVFPPHMILKYAHCHSLSLSPYTCTLHSLRSSLSRHIRCGESVCAVSSPSLLLSPHRVATYLVFVRRSLCRLPLRTHKHTHAAMDTSHDVDMEGGEREREREKEEEEETISALMACLSHLIDGLIFGFLFSSFFTLSNLSHTYFQIPPFSDFSLDSD